MPALSAPSEVILRHENQFANRYVLFAGHLRDALPQQLEAADCRAWTTDYHQWSLLHGLCGDNAQFGLLATAEMLGSSDTLIYYWPKSKEEAQFQLHQLISLLPPKSELFIVGENHSGVRSAEKLLSAFCTIQKIDSARHCSLYHAKINQSTNFSLSAWWHTYAYKNVTVATLPGVFSRGQLDSGSELLLSTFDEQIQGDVLDLGCGAGVLACTLAKYSEHRPRLTLSDVNAAALAASQATLARNEIDGRVIASDVFSEIEGQFDWIISNPPFHQGLQSDFLSVEALIQGAMHHLKPGGKLRIVANAFLPYPQWLDQAFGSHQLIARTGKFKVYQAMRSTAVPIKKSKNQAAKR